MQTTNKEKLAVMNLLIVEDQEAIRWACIKTAESAGFNVYSTVSPQQGLSIARDHQVDVVLTDLTLQGMSGAEFHSAILRINPDVSVILMSGLSIWDARIYEVPFAYLEKPFRMEDLRSILTNVRQARLRCHQQGETSTAQ